MEAIWTLIGVAIAGSVAAAIQVLGNKRHTQAETDLNIVTAAKEVIGQYRQRVQELEERIDEMDRKSSDCERRADVLAGQMRTVIRHVEQLETALTIAGLDIPTRPPTWPAA